MYADMDSSMHIPAGSDNKETAEIGTGTLHNSTNFQYQLIWESSFKWVVYEEWLQKYR